MTTALPEIVSDLGGLSYISWVVTAYLLASTIGAPIAGKLGDMYGRKIVLQGAIGVFLLGGIVCGLARNMEMLILGRVFQGLGGGSLIVVSMATVADILPPRERGRAQGALSSVFGLSTVLGPLIGGFIVQNLGWHWVFFANFPVGLLAFSVLTKTLQRSTDRTPHKMDFMGAALLAVLLSSTVLLANLGGTVYSWSSLPVLVLLAAAPLALVGFISAERRAAEPVMPLDLFRIRNFQAANSVNLLVGMAMFGTVAFMPMFLQVVKGVPPVDSGLYLVAMMLGLIGTSFFSGRYITRYGRYRMLPILSTMLLTVAMFLMSTIGPDTPMPVIVLYLFLTGIGIGPTMSVGVVSIQLSIPRAHLGVGTASANMFRLTGGSIGTSIFGAIFAVGLVDHVAPLLPGGLDGRDAVTTEMIAGLMPGQKEAVIQAFSDAMTPIYLVASVLAALACLAALRLMEHPIDSAQAGTAPAE